MKPAILKITKELFVCDNIANVTEENMGFECRTEPFNTPIGERTFISPPDSGQYISCNDIECPGVDESDFAVQVYKDVTIADDLSSTVPTPVDLTKINYFVSEDEPEDPIKLLSECYVSGFDYLKTFVNTLENKLEENLDVRYNICVLHEGDCEGTIYPGEVKECTVKNFIHSGDISIFLEPE